MPDESQLYISQAEAYAEALPGDDTLVKITAYQAAKIAGIAGAVAQGHLAPEALQAIADFMQAVGLEAKHAGIKPSSDKAWAEVESFTPPPPGGPRPQQD